MSAWSIESTVLLVALLVVLVFAVRRIRIEHRRRNSYRRKLKP